MFSLLSVAVENPQAEFEPLVLLNVQHSSK